MQQIQGEVLRPPVTTFYDFVHTLATAQDPSQLDLPEFPHGSVDPRAVSEVPYHDDGSYEHSLGRVPARTTLHAALCIKDLRESDGRWYAEFRASGIRRASFAVDLPDGSVDALFRLGSRNFVADFTVSDDPPRYDARFRKVDINSIVVHGVEGQFDGTFSGATYAEAEPRQPSRLLVAGKVEQVIPHDAVNPADIWPPIGGTANLMRIRYGNEEGDYTYVAMQPRVIQGGSLRDRFDIYEGDIMQVPVEVVGVENMARLYLADDTSVPILYNGHNTMDSETFVPWLLVPGAHRQEIQDGRKERLDMLQATLADPERVTADKRGILATFVRENYQLLPASFRAGEGTGQLLIGQQTREMIANFLTSIPESERPVCSRLVESSGAYDKIFSLLGQAGILSVGRLLELSYTELTELLVDRIGAQGDLVFDGMTHRLYAVALGVVPDSNKMELIEHVLDSSEGFGALAANFLNSAYVYGWDDEIPSTMQPYMARALELLSESPAGSLNVLGLDAKRRFMQQTLDYIQYYTPGEPGVEVSAVERAAACTAVQALRQRLSTMNHEFREFPPFLSDFFSRTNTLLADKE